jgi:hypothetical protein
MPPSGVIPAQKSAWQQGSHAARAGKPANANPYHPINYDFVVWNNGWSFTMYQKAQEDNEL